jgi:TM2 domain-containing membrane protein YozV
MDCVNHSGVAATAYCQNCGKALCAGCVRGASQGQVLCEPCLTAWHSYQQPFVAVPPPGSPNPGLAAVLGLIPGVGAMYNGQFVKGLIHVAIFAVLVSAADHFGIFGLFIAAWVFYQVFEAYHTAKARRDGLPLPDPLGLNEVGNWLGIGGRPPVPGQPGTATGTGPFPAGQPGQGPATGATGSYPPPYAGPGQYPYQAPYSYPYQQQYQPPPPGFPPVPPVPPPPHWRRREPIAAIVLIALGVLFLLGQMDLFSGRLVEFTWPVVLIALGGWLLVRRLQDSRDTPHAGPGTVSGAPAPQDSQSDSHEDSQGGSL